MNLKLQMKPLEEIDIFIFDTLIGLLFYKVPEYKEIVEMGEDSLFSDRSTYLFMNEFATFDAFDAGVLSNSWRQQPGSPVYCTDLTQKEIRSLIDTAKKERLPKRRDLAILAITERLGGISKDLDPEYLLRINRALYI
ncbi:hypothetical protein D7322_08465 [Sphingobacterium puteale]|uniref:Uncharacterized protein n=1 Tax=Sphingobacterium puteale TaxID=2420510 RepID=A0A420W0M1_9SPHI|nr:hypothetical protein [Sphingobacterium puteale]RKO72116.1 hypothetical protein D7322_08465 [Sphingobacterium puteale]